MMVLYIFRLHYYKLKVVADAAHSTTTSNLTNLENKMVEEEHKNVN